MHKKEVRSSPDGVVEASSPLPTVCHPARPGHFCFAASAAAAPLSANAAAAVVRIELLLSGRICFSTRHFSSH